MPGKNVWRWIATAVFVAAARVACAGTPWSEDTHQLAFGDFNGDGRTDVLYVAKDRTLPSGIALSDGATPSISHQSWPSNFLGIPWHGGVYKAYVADFNGDSRADILLQRQSPGDHYLLLANSAGQITAINQTIPNVQDGQAWSADAHRIVLGDFDGNGRADVLLQATVPAAESAIFLADPSGLFGAAKQRWGNLYMGFRWSLQDAFIVSGKFNADTRSDLLIQARPRVVVADPHSALSLPIYRTGSFGIVLARPENASHEILFSPALQIWDRFFQGVDWSAANFEALVANFDGTSQDDIFLQARRPGQTNRLLRLGGEGQVVSGNSLDAASPLANLTADGQRLHPVRFGSGSSSGLYVQSVTEGGSNQIAGSVLAGGLVTHDPASINVITPGTAVGSVPGEFSVDPSGAANYKIDIGVPPGVAGLTPELGLVYSSRGENGLLGVGWQVAGLSAITRCPTTAAQDGTGNADGVDFDGNDAFCLDGQRLMAVAGSNGSVGAEYRTELESHQKVTSAGATAGDPDSFSVWDKAGLIREYGTQSPLSGNKMSATDSRFEARAPNGTPGPALVWAIKVVRDRFDNFIEYRYDQESASNATWPVELVYGSKYSGARNVVGRVVFTYTPRADTRSGYMTGGYATALTKRLQKVSVYGRTNVTAPGANDLVRQYYLDYEYSSTTKLSHLIGVTLCDGGQGALQRCFKSSRFQWQYGNRGFTSGSVASDVDFGSTVDLKTLDADGDGRNDYVYRHSAGQNTGQWLVRYASLIHSKGIGGYVATGIDRKQSDRAFAIDWNNDGYTDLVESSQTVSGSTGFAGNYRVLLGGPGGFKASNVAQYPSLVAEALTFKNLGTAVGDFDGDGRQDIAYVPSLHSEIAIFSGALKLRLNNSSNPQAGLESGTVVSAALGFVGPVPYVPPPTLPWHFDKSSAMALDYQSSDFKDEPAVYAINFDGDGRDDVLVRVSACYERPSITTSGTACITEFHVYSVVDGELRRVWGVQFASGYVTHLKTGDFNGDGLTDLLSWGVGFDPQAATTGWHLDIGTGSRGASGVPPFKSAMAATSTSIQSECSDIDFTAISIIRNANFTGSNCTEPTTVPLTEQMLDSAMPFDYNRDGYTDLILARAGNWQVLPGGPAGYINSFLNTGRAARQWKYAMLVDDGGDGLPDIMFPAGSSPDNNWHVYYGRGPAVQGVIERITDGYGAQTTIQYLPLTATTNTSSYTGTVYKGHTRFPEDAASASEADFRSETVLGWPYAHASGPVPVVYQYTADNALGAPGSSQSSIRTTYEYWGLKIHREGRGTLGFSQVRSWNDNSELETRNRFAQKAFPNFGMLLTAEQRFRDLAVVNASLASGFNPNLLLLKYAAPCDDDPGCSQLNPAPSGYDESAGYKRVTFTTNVISATVNTYGNGTKTYFPYIRKSSTDTYPVSAGVVGDQPYKRVVSEYLQSPGATADAELAAGTPAYDAFGNPGSVRITSTNGATGGTPLSRDEHVVLTTNTFSNDTSNWCLSRLTGTTVTHTKPATNTSGNGHAPTTLTRTASFTFQAGSQCVLLSETTEPSAASGQLRVSKTYSYDTYGNRFKQAVGGYGITAANERVSGSMLADGSSSFISSQGQLPSESRNALGHVERTSWDGRFGLATVVTDSNGLSASTQYDTFGRAARATPLTSLPAAYSEQALYWCANTGMCWDARAVFSLRKYASDGKESWEEHDRLGRAIASRELGFDGNWIAAEKYFDPLGREYLASRPYKPAIHSTRCWSIRKFDVLDRPILEWSSYASAECSSAVPGFLDNPASLGPGKQSEIVYDIVPNPALAGSQGANGIAQRISGNTTDGSEYGTARVSYKFVNVMDRTRFVQDGLSISGCASNGMPLAANSGSCLQTEYDYDAQGNLTFTKQAGTLGGGANAIDRVLETRSWFNLRGLKTQMSDPDMGIWTYGYNAFGDLESQTDARGQVTQLGYDKLGRLVSRVEKLPDGATELSAAWQYDTEANGIGKLSNTTASDGYGEWHSYDAFGRESRVRRRIGGSYYYLDRTFDALGRLEVLKYPGSVNGDSSSGAETDNNRLRIRNVYNSVGFLESVQDAATGKSYWRGDAANEDGALTQETLGNSLVTRRYFDRSSGHLVSLKTGSAANDSDVQNLEFAFDQAANLRMRKDRSVDVNGAGGIREEYAYDGLYRLRQMRQYKPAGLGTSSPTLVQNYSYDSFGNLLSKGSISAYCYNTQASGTDGCSGTNNQLPHAAKRVVVNGVTRDYTFNENGHVIAATNAMYDSVSWFVSNLARRVSKGNKYTEFAYAPDRSRYRQYLYRSAGENETTDYAGGDYERLTRVSGGVTSVEHTHYIRAGATVIALAKRLRTGSSAPGSLYLRYLHRDQLGSIVALTDGAGQLLERSGFDPWGKRTSFQTWEPVAPGQYTSGGTGSSGLTTGVVSTKRGFTGHEHVEELGFVHMNGRIYDAELGRFFSPDPTTQFPESTQGFNRYAYAGNNPLTNVDPSGFSFANVLGILGQILQFIPATFWLGMLMSAISGFLQGGAAGALLSIASSLAGPRGTGSFWYRVGYAAAQSLISNTVLGAANGYQTSLGQSFSMSLKRLPRQVAISCATLKLTEVIDQTVSEARAAGTKSKDYLVQVEDLATENASLSEGANSTLGHETAAFANTSGGRHITSIEAHSREELRSAIGWVHGEQAVFFGKRALSLPGFKPIENWAIGDFLNIEYLHEEVFWFDAEGDLFSLGYGPEGIRSDLANRWSVGVYMFTPAQLRLDASVNVQKMLLRMPPAYHTTRATRIPVDWSGKSYDFPRHNCQDFSSAAHNLLMPFAR